MQAQQERRRVAMHPRHPVEGRGDDRGRGTYQPALTKDWSVEVEFPGQQQTTRLWSAEQQESQDPFGRPNLRPDASSKRRIPPLFDPTPLIVEKSNVLLLGPSGVGKTLMAKTLARVLEVPFSMSDCTPMTQSGYIGEDVDVCVQRLLAAANYDIARAERGIICLDEIDKIATAKVSHGKDVSGEGVQQSLLKIIEGTTLQFQAKAERSSSTQSPNRTTANARGFPTNGPLRGGSADVGSHQSSAGGQKAEIYSVKTDDILFICAGAFNGLHRIILDRVSKGSIGFGANIRTAPGLSSDNSSQHETILEGEDQLFDQHLPYYDAPPPVSPVESNSSIPPPRQLNTLDLLQPQDLQKYGLIPELVGRIPLTCALSSLSPDALVKVLTEPRNSLLKQYEHLFHLSSVELRLTTAALHGIAALAAGMGTGARALRTVLERLLADAMFETPGSGVRHVLVTRDVVDRKCGPVYFSRGERTRFHDLIAREEEAWADERNVGRGEDVLERRARINREGGPARTFEEYREKTAATGS